MINHRSLIKGNPRVVLCLYYVLQGMLFATWSCRIPDIMRALNMDEATLGLVLFSIPIGQMLTMSSAAGLISRFTSRKMLIVSVLLCSLSLLSIGLIQSTIQLVVALLIFGGANTLLDISVNTQGVNVERRLGRTVMSTFHGTWSLGGFTGGVIGMGAVALGLSPIAHFGIVALLSILIAFVGCNGLTSPDAPAISGDEAAQKVSFIKRLDAHILLLGALGFCAYASEGCLYDWSGIFFEESVHASADMISIGYIVAMCAVTSGRFMSDYLVRIYGANRVIFFSGILIASGVAISVAFPTMITATIGFVLIGFGISSTSPLSYSMAGRSSKLSPSVAITMVSAIGYSGFYIGPSLLGFIAQEVTIRWAFMAMICVGIALTLLSPKLKKY